MAGNRIALVVDHETSTRKLVASFLQLAGFSVVEAVCATEAIRLFHGRRRAVTVLVTSVYLPGMDGIALAEQLLAAQPDLRVAFLSGYCAAEPHALPGSAWIRKPLDFGEFLSRIRRLLES